MKETDKTILIVDDEPHIVLALEVLFEQSGHRVLTASTGQEGLQQCQVHRPDVVILDVMMPEMDGLTMARTLRGMPGMEQVVVIFLTAKGTPADRMNGYDAGGEYYVAKPFDNDALFELVEEVLSFGD